MRVLLGISGGIAAYKTAELVRLYRQRGDAVQVVVTRAAREFVSPLTLATLSGGPVLEDLFSPPLIPSDAPSGAPIEHIAVAQAADVAVIAPATAHTLARLAHGLADDLLTTVLLATPAPVVVAPAMNLQMWRHPATQANLELLRARGVAIVPPGEGYLACGMVGEGRMADLEAIVEATRAAAPATAGDLAGETLLVTAGPTREAIDPVRYLTNRSSGRMGYALAAAAARRGAQVTLISGPTSLPVPAGVSFIPVVSAAEMDEAARAAFERCTIALLAAAVADYRPVHVHPHKVKKTDAPVQLELERTPDILASLGRRKLHQLLVGFAAETDSARAVALARAKLAAKGADLIVLNDVSRPGIGFDVDQNEVTLLTAASEQPLARAPKSLIADQILDAVLRLPRHALPYA